MVDYIVLEIAENGELFDYLYFPGKGFGEDFGRYLFKELVNGLEACHKAGVAHRDLKTENIMMNDDWTLKIADFGYATFSQKKCYRKIEYLSWNTILCQSRNSCKNTIFRYMCRYFLMWCNPLRSSNRKTPIW